MLRTQNWQRPDYDMLKCNVDANFFTINGSPGWGWCVLDCHGHFINADSGWTQATFTIIEGEAMTSLQACREAVAQGWTNVMFESDSKIVVDALHSI
ncbi:eukaryotic translation initiation factor 3 subunit c [Trifolium pratense]|uniref:Eukaryotic translation initiation factor 3 subunit c n=1 Tax=Trifolium pratense TaxID=57577 RepID=A0A2K3NK73_TRIPR|nr:eukaryotic translation initiation factor 3 subunit c [Trifolium pratense]PNY03434.1 eukaryotic translation initiation factor 3 subunit c [Trifolium pratense]PNY03503.1 eukaryotic translation initiation factor 3 subunit c [Trifolium pratense]